jgi:hypothetical protein
MGYIDTDASLQTFVVNEENSAAPDTCSSLLVGDWTHPVIHSYPFMALIGTTTGPYSISSLDVLKSKLYVTADRRAYKSDPTLFVFDLSSVPTMQGKGGGGAAATQGLTSVRVAEDFAHAKRYAYTSSKTATQFQSFDVTNAAAVAAGPTKALAGGEGNTILYHDGYIFMGLAALSGLPELKVIDVRTPTAPALIGTWPPSGAIGSGINAIVVRDGYAYLAHGATASYSEQISVLNVKTPASPFHVSGYVAPAASTFPNSGNGKALSLVGTTLLLGRTASNKVGVPQFLLVDDAAPAALPAAAKGAAVLVPDISINKIIVKDSLAFVLTNKTLLVYRIDDPASTSLTVTVNLPSFGGSTEPSMDCEGDTLYVGSNDASNIGTLSVITAG